MEWSNFQADIFEATKYDDSNLMIQACAGSGKTTVLVEIAKLCPGNVMFLAFNKSIQTELKQRLGDSADCKTFHSYGLGLIKQEIGWYPKVDSNKVYDAIKLRFPYIRGEWSPRKVMNRIIKKMRGLGFMSYDGEEITEFLHQNVGCFSYSAQERVREQGWAHKNIHEIQYLLHHLDELPVKQEIVDGRDRFPKYRTVIDFDDMVRYPCVYNIAARKRVYSNTVLVDEVQDTSPYQFHLLNQLYGRDVRIIVVGDRLQAIYAFRGSYADSMDRVGDHIEARELPLSVTYRCREGIVDFTNEQIDGSDMIPHKDGGEVTFIDRTRFVDMVKEHNVPMIIGAKNKSLVRAWLDLARFKIASTLKDKGITREIRRILEDYKVVPTEGNAPEMSIEELVVAINDAIREGYQIDEDGTSSQTLPLTTVDMYECIKEIIQIHHINHYAAFLNLLDEMDQDSDHELHTVHSAKGLEAKSVIVLGDWFDNSQLMNMKYVAYTRAEDLLIIVTDWEKEEDIEIPQYQLAEKTDLDEEKFETVDEEELVAPF